MRQANRLSIKAATTEEIVIYSRTFRLNRLKIMAEDKIKSSEFVSSSDDSDNDDTQKTVQSKAGSGPKLKSVVIPKVAAAPDESADRFKKLISHSTDQTNLEQSRKSLDSDEVKRTNATDLEQQESIATKSDSGDAASGSATSAVPKESVKPIIQFADSDSEGEAAEPGQHSKNRQQSISEAELSTSMELSDRTTPKRVGPNIKHTKKKV